MPEKNLTPQDHNEKRREKKRKQRANAKAAAAHKKKEGDVETRVIIDGEFNVDDLCWEARERNYNYITFHFLLKLMRERKLAIHINRSSAVPEVDGKVIYPTPDGWQWEDGTPIESAISINRVVVPLTPIVAVIFTWRYNRRDRKYWMEVQ